MTGPIIVLSLAGCAAYFYSMSALGKWLARSADAATYGRVANAPELSATQPRPSQADRIAS
jgi:hypothetical protein